MPEALFFGIRYSFTGEDDLASANDFMEKCLRKAGDALKVFRRELGDVNLPADVHIETSDFLTFADFFFDGILADFLVQSRIKKAWKEINDMIIRVVEVLTQLKRIAYADLGAGVRAWRCLPGERRSDLNSPEKRDRE